MSSFCEQPYESNNLQPHIDSDPQTGLYQWPLTTIVCPVTSTSQQWHSQILVEPSLDVHSDTPKYWQWPPQTPYFSQNLCSS